MSYELLAKRLDVVDGYLPKEQILQALEAGDSAKMQIYLWQRIGIASVAFAVIALVFAAVATHRAEIAVVEAGTYQKMCVTPEVADKLIDFNNTIADVNRRCLALHQSNAEFFQDLIALDDTTHQCLDLGRQPDSHTLVSAAVNYTQ